MHKKIIMDEKIQGWLKLKREQVKNCFVKSSKIIISHYLLLLFVNNILVIFLTNPGEAQAIFKAEQ